MTLRSVGLALVFGIAVTALAGIGHAQQASPPPAQRPAMSPAAGGIGEDLAPVAKQPPATKFYYPTGPDIFVPLPSSPFVQDTSQYKIRVVTVVNGLSRPFGMAFLPDGSLLVTERTGRLRHIVNGMLDPQPISGVPKVVSRPYEGLMDIALHPKFADNHWVYLSYTKGDERGATGMTLARGRLDGNALKDVTDIYFVDQWTERAKGPTLASRIAFDRAGNLFMAIGCSTAISDEAQKTSSALGKVIRLRDDGTPVPDNPFVGKAGYRPEIYTIGHRNPLGLAMNPSTGEMFENENGPQGGDEINLLKPGKNYGWPVVSQGRDYGGTSFPTHQEVPGMEAPFMYWNPAIAISGLMFYTGDAFPNWKGNIFVGSLAYAHLERLTFNPTWESTGGREHMLNDLKQRIRDVRQGPDGNIYVLTDAAYGALLRIERAD